MLPPGVSSTAGDSCARTVQAVGAQTCADALAAERCQICLCGLQKLQPSVHPEISTATIKTLPGVSLERKKDR